VETREESLRIMSAWVGPKSSASWCESENTATCACVRKRKPRVRASAMRQELSMPGGCLIERASEAKRKVPGDAREARRVPCTGLMSYAE